jgi:hypothetical protein
MTPTQYFPTTSHSKIQKPACVRTCLEQSCELEKINEIEFQCTMHRSQISKFSLKFTEKNCITTHGIERKNFFNGELSEVQSENKRNTRDT